MQTDVRHDATERRFVVEVDGSPVGVVEYREEPAVRSFLHTQIADGFEGQGLGGRLVRAALDQTRAEGLTVQPFCPYVRRFIAEHLEYLDLMPAASRARFQLSPAP